MIKLKDEIIDDLSKAGYTTYKMRQKKWISEGTLQHIRNGENVSMDTVNAICCMLKKKPEDILEFEITDEEILKYYLR